MKTYADLDLMKIRDECGLDFARHTYSKEQCSCCFGPLDMPAEYWRGEGKPIELEQPVFKSGKAYDLTWNGELMRSEDISFILFQNAANGTGRIRSLNEPIRDNTCIRYQFKDEEQKRKVCQMLQEQLGDEYYVEVPEDDMTCIVIWLKEDCDEEDCETTIS